MSKDCCRCEFERGAWFAFDAVLAWINTRDMQMIDKADLYQAVMQMRPHTLGLEQKP